MTDTLTICAQHFFITLCKDKDITFPTVCVLDREQYQSCTGTSSLLLFLSVYLSLCILVLAQHCFYVGAGCSCSDQKAAS